MPCTSSISNCSACYDSGGTLLCSSCQSGFLLSANNLTCDSNPCATPNCAACTADPNVCESCVPGFYLATNKTCYTICGDNVTAGTEQCDDGNNVDGDGCNSDCTTGNNNGCAASTPYINPVSNTCTSTCPVGYFADPAAFTCLACMYSCTTCTDNSTCSSCSSATHRYLNGTQCLPQPGFFDNSTNVAPACVSPCATCTSLSVCTTCLVGFYLSGSTCLACSTVTANCSRCDAAGTTCTSCQLGYVLNASTLACDVVPCYDLHCLACPNSMAVCTQCSSGYRPVNGVC